MVNSLRVANCQGQHRKAVPDTDSSVQALLLNFNAFSAISGTSFPRMASLTFLSLGKQLGGCLSVGERAFQNVSNVTFLDLGGNGNVSLHPAAFRGLAKLEVLLLDANGFGEGVLESGFFQDLVSLKRLDLSGNHIRWLRPDPSFRGLAALSVLQLKLNRIEGICGDDLEHLRGRHLDLLDLSSNRLLRRSACRNAFRNLTLGTLDVSGNPWNVKEAERFFAGLDGAKIRHLALRHSGAIGSGFGFHNLQDLSGSTFSRLRQAGVVSLDMSHGFLHELVSSAFTGLPDLSRLLLRSHRIGRIQDGAFAGLGKLRALDLSDNLLGELYLESLKGSPIFSPSAPGPQVQPHRNRKLPSLRRLLLGQNRIRDAWGVECLGGNVTHLDLASNRLADLGQLWGQLGELPHLRFLNLSHNRLAQCLRVRKSPPALRALDLSHNVLGVIWEGGRCMDIFQGSPKLVALNLSSSALRRLPEGLFRVLGALENLDLSSNLLSELPDRAFQALGSLHTLSLRGNPLLTLSPAPFAALGKLQLLDLRRLSLVCDCGLSDIQVWVEEKARVLSEGDNGTLLCLLLKRSFFAVALSARLPKKPVSPSIKQTPHFLHWRGDGNSRRQQMNK
ncbi:hypothetical protein JRQ81_009523 [Phrynocephalus forsythii]|uniref:Toll-like receptor 5 n=1 Tax=Phrynocephalus forsythii TaxID=171643 RepID=A0A9Q0XBY3_9SAUR|nr:hypothetical protein JRQ81_009523 [Phrynocephalus forsythii]